MLELAPNLGKNERGEFKLWLVFYRETNTSMLGRGQDLYVSSYSSPTGLNHLHYATFPWIWRGTPNASIFHAMADVGFMTSLPPPWPLWSDYRRKLFSDFKEIHIKGDVPCFYPWKWVLANDVSEAAIRAAIQRKETIDHESIGPAEIRAQVVQVG